MNALRIIQRLIAWFMPPGIDPESTASFRLQATVSVSFLVGNSGFPFIFVFFFMGKPQEGFVVLWSWVIFMCIPFLARSSTKPHLLAHALSANYFQCHLFLCLLFGGVDAPNTMWFAATPIVSVLVGGIAHGIIWGAVAATSVLLVYALETFKFIHLPAGLDPEQQLFILATGTVGLLAAIFGATASFEMLRSSAISRRRRAERELRHANSDLKVLDAQKTSFFQNVSHELRTPLTLILPPLDDAVRQRPDDAQMTMAARNARRLLRLVNQLLDLQKLTAGKREVHIEPLELIGFMNICTDSFRSACSSKDIQLTVKIDGAPLEGVDSMLWVEGETDALEKIVFNFLSNALKFTEQGGAIEFGAERAGQRVRLYVQDTGRGIAESDLPKLFKVFSQVDSSSKRAYEGSGLGLALSKSLADELGAEIGVESEAGVGSRFWLDLSLIDAPSGNSSKPSTPAPWLIDRVVTSTEMDVLHLSPNGPPNGPLVLVVDDLADLRALVIKFLHRQGYRTIQASNGSQALQIAMERKPDIIITDWMMPVMTGPELVQALRGNPDLASIPSILLTAKSDEESRLMGTALGADAFLGKPFNEEELMSVVRNLVSLKTREREIEALNQKLTETVLKRYLPPSLVDRIIDDDLQLGEPEMRTVTVLFSDICNFTTVAEDLGPKVIAELLNDYLTTMTSTIFHYEGTIDKFIGDGIMVMFGAPVKLSDIEQAERAAACAFAMQHVMKGFALRCEQRGLPKLDIRIGIHQGEAVVGNFGSNQRLDYTCIGPMVNIAARIESACPPGRVMISQEIKRHLDGASLSEAGLFKLKGVQGQRPLFVIDELETRQQATI